MNYFRCICDPPKDGYVHRVPIDCLITVNGVTKFAQGIDSWKPEELAEARKLEAEYAEAVRSHS